MMDQNYKNARELQQALLGQYQHSQLQQNNFQNMLGNLGLGYGMQGIGYSLGVPTAPAIVRCAYCGKRPKHEHDDRCDGCGAPR